VTYFFVSNDAKKERNTYQLRIQAVLEKLTQKAQALKEKLQAEKRVNEELREELRKTNEEIELLKAELERVKRASTEETLAATTTLVVQSQVLRQFKYKPSLAINYLDSRSSALDQQLLQLLSQV